MAIRMVINFENPKFKKISREVVHFDDKLGELLDDMLATLRYVQGYGLAAVHVGVLKRAIVIDDENGVIELVNPVITKVSEEMQGVMEGSISADSPRGIVERPLRVEVSGKDRQGNPVTISGEGFLAATLCHEIDHLDGISYADKIIGN